jgi:hypothetical protein
MGLLDDAIREHLDLKRRRGADPAEVERAERDALGPVRRGPEPVDPDQPPGDEVPPGPLDYGDEPQWEDESAGHEPYAEEPLQERDSSFNEAPLPREDPAAYHQPLNDEPRSAEPGEADDDPLADVPPLQFESSSSPPPHPAPGSPLPHSDETAEYDVEEELGKQEDVLEETPEFLQDAPEHDRLWFEQRPPRDFDFNE